MNAKYKKYLELCKQRNEGVRLSKEDFKFMCNYGRALHSSHRRLIQSNNIRDMAMYDGRTNC